MIAEEIMTKEVITVGPEDLVERVLKILNEKKISGLPVVDQENRVIGIVSEGDLLVRSKDLRLPSYLQFLSGIIYLESPERFEREIKKAVATKVKDIMTSKVITAHPNTSVTELATLMVEKQVNRLPITQDNRLVGIVSRADVIRAQSK